MVKSKEKEKTKVSEKSSTDSKKLATRLDELNASLKLIDAQLSQLKQKQRDTINWMNTSQEVGRKQLRAFENMKSSNFLQEEQLKLTRNLLLDELKSIKEEQ